ncbi:MAG: EF-hand domain-containing protein [Planctomycetes bacterium]|nr:EF-hand domain-containing protein [Planctomycetota bacterium]MBI3833095.1 EF-hand domain-containing protein [Planctomycetota bacterium]
MNRKTIVGVGLFIAFGMAFALAKPQGTRGPGQARNAPPRPGPRIVAALDTDRDGEISAEEIATAAESLLALDANGDGKLTPDEIGRGPREGSGLFPPPPPPHPGPMHLDSDGDGVVSLDEFLAPAIDHFHHIDANGDGVIDDDEAANVGPPPMRGHPPQGPGGLPNHH